MNMKDLVIDLHNCIEFKEEENKIVCGGSYELDWTIVDYYYSYPKCNDNKLRRIYATNKVHKKLCELVYNVFNPLTKQDEQNN